MFFHGLVDPRDLHSFPTRRSSDLARQGWEMRACSPWITISCCSPWWTTELVSSARPDRKSTRLNSSHVAISYAVFCLKKQKNEAHQTQAEKFHDIARAADSNRSQK